MRERARIRGRLRGPRGARPGLLLVVLVVLAALLGLGAGCGKNKQRKPGKRATVQLQPVSLQRWNQVRLVRVAAPPDPEYWLRIPGEWYSAEGLSATAHYRYAGHKELKLVFRSRKLLIDGKVVGVDLRRLRADQVRTLLDPIAAPVLSVTLDVKQADPALWKALAGSKATALFFRLSQGSHEDKPAPVGPVLARLKQLGTRVVGLRLAGQGFDAAAMAGLKPLAGLRYLQLENSRLTAAGLARLVDAAPGLETLLLDWEDSREKGIDDEGLAEISRLSRLQRLQVNGKKITKKGLRALRRCKHLRVLSLSVVNIADRDLRVVGELSGLTWLHVWFQHFGPAVMDGICKLDELRVLQVGPDVAPSDLACLARLKQLRSLALRSQAVRDDTLAHLKGLTHLVDLNLSRATVTGAGLRHLRGLSGLRRLNLFWLNAAFDSASLEHVAALRGLEVLNLSRLSLQDADLPKLHGLKRLRKLQLYGVKTLSPESVSQLKKALPGCDVGGPR